MIMMARMARPVSEKVRRVDRLLRDHIEAGGLGPGERFPSTRAIARRHDICYQTAHRIVTALVAEGLEFHIPKGYIYFAMGFSVFVEWLNFRLRRGGSKPVTPHQAYLWNTASPAESSSTVDK